MSKTYAYMKSFFNGFEVVILDFYEAYNLKGDQCRYAKCYIPALDCTEGILLSHIYIN